MNVDKIKNDIIWIYYDEVMCTCADKIIDHLDDYFEDVGNKSVNDIEIDMISIYEDEACGACKESILEGIKDYFENIKIK